MTVSVEIGKAISARAAGFRYVRSSDLVVLSLVGKRDSHRTQLRGVLHACVAELEAFLVAWSRALPQLRVLLFVATMCSDQHNVVSRRRGVWGRERLAWLPAGAPRSPCVEIHGQHGDRFAGVAEIPAAGLFDAADFARTHTGAFLYISRCGDLTEDLVRSIAAKAFPGGGADLDWANLLEQLAEGEEVCVRVSGGFDDLETSIDVFLTDELSRKLGIR